MLKKMLVSLLFCFLAQPVFASIEFHKIEVKNLFEKGNDEYILIFKPLDKMSSLSMTQFTSLHIRFNANCVTELKQSDNPKVDREKYLESLDELKNQISKSKFITFGLKSGKGFRKIIQKTAVNHYQCDNLSLLKMGDQKIVYAIHADVSDGYCE